jgi:hypothetical protein
MVLNSIKHHCPQRRYIQHLQPPYSSRTSPRACRALRASFTRWRDSPHQVGQLLLRDAQHVAHAGVQHVVEQGGQAGFEQMESAPLLVRV